MLQSIEPLITLSERLTRISSIGFIIATWSHVEDFSYDLVLILVLKSDSNSHWWKWWPRTRFSRWNWILCMEWTETSSTAHEIDIRAQVQRTYTNTTSVHSCRFSPRKGWLCDKNQGISLEMMSYTMIFMLVVLCARMLWVLQRQVLGKHWHLVCPFFNVCLRSEKRPKGSFQKMENWMIKLPPQVSSAL